MAESALSNFPRVRRAFVDLGTVLLTYFDFGDKSYLRTLTLDIHRICCILQESQKLSEYLPFSFLNLTNSSAGQLSHGLLTNSNAESYTQNLTKSSTIPYFQNLTNSNTGQYLENVARTNHLGHNLNDSISSSYINYSPFSASHINFLGKFSAGIVFI